MSRPSPGRYIHTQPQQAVIAARCSPGSMLQKPSAGHCAPSTSFSVQVQRFASMSQR